MIPSRLMVMGAAIALAAVAGGAWVAVRHRDPVAAVLAGDTDAASLVRAPEGVRVRVQVLNATRTRGLARRATLHLRERGFDVVDLGTASPVREETLVLDRSGHPEWARSVAAALGGARIESRPDTSRYLDVTVLLGGTWRAPTEPFHP